MVPPMSPGGAGGQDSEETSLKRWSKIWGCYRAEGGITLIDISGVQDCVVLRLDLASSMRVGNFARNCLVHGCAPMHGSGSGAQLKSQFGGEIP